MISADGYFEGRDNDISWHNVDDEVNDFFIEQMKNSDTILFGRKTFEVMENYWPTKEAFATDPIVATMMSRFLKIVFSTTRNSSGWDNSKFINSNAPEEIKKLKLNTSKDIFVFGSSDFCKTLIKHELIDEFRLMVNPIILGTGNPFFHTKMKWQLLKTRVFGNGNALLCYMKTI